MKIGQSLSRCVLDIFLKEVDINDVMVIITRTDFDPHNNEHWNDIWRGYTGGAGFNTRTDWTGYKAHESEFRNIVTELYSLGKLHQPRQYGASPPRTLYHWLETIVPEQEIEDKPAVKKAWENYKLIAGLS